MNQRGFATLEIVMAIVILGILASIAIPNFANVSTKANTAKIQADLSTIDTAIQMYYMEQGDYPSTVDELVSKDYLMDKPTPPKGKAYVDGTPTEISTIDSGNKGYIVGDKSVGSGNSSKTTKRAKLGEKVAGDFSLTTK